VPPPTKVRHSPQPPTMVACPACSRAMYSVAVVASPVASTASYCVGSYARLTSVVSGSPPPRFAICRVTDVQRVAAPVASRGRHPAVSVGYAGTVVRVVPGPGRGVSECVGDGRQPRRSVTGRDHAAAALVRRRNGLCIGVIRRSHGDGGGIGAGGHPTEDPHPQVGRMLRDQNGAARSPRVLVTATDSFRDRAQCQAAAGPMLLADPSWPVAR
jgi:hypothetical protein